MSHVVADQRIQTRSRVTMDDVENYPLQLLFTKPPIPTVGLTLDAMYYHAAMKCLQRAREAEPEVNAALECFEGLRINSERVLKEHNGDFLEAYSELEPLYIQMDGASERAGFAYAPLLEATASAHILCVAALEVTSMRVVWSC